MKVFSRVLLIFAALILVTLGISYMVSGGQSEIINHVSVQKSPDVVFDYITDMRNELKWNPDVMFMEKQTNGPIGKGTSFRAKWHLSDTINVFVTHYERPYEVTFENGGPIEVTLQLKLNSNGPKTELESRFIATPHGFVRAIFPIFKARIKAQERQNMVNLKNAIDKL